MSRYSYQASTWKEGRWALSLIAISGSGTGYLLDSEFR
jgi:hypothetical protein